MKKLFAILLGVLFTVIPFSAIADSSSKLDSKPNADVIQEFIPFSYKDNGKDNNIVLEKFLYNSNTGIPYMFEGEIKINNEYIDVTDNLKCLVSDQSVLKTDNINRIYANRVGKSQATISYKDYKKTYNVEVIDPVPVRYKLPLDSIILDSKGKTKQLNAFADMIDGTTIDIGKAVNWESEDPNIASVDDTGLVIAESKGKTYVSATLNKTTLIIPVEVQSSEYCDEIKAFIYEASKIQPEEYDNEGMSILAVTATERDNIISRASAIFNYGWTPVKDLVGWKAGFTFKAGTLYRGLPYTQINHTDHDSTIVAGLTGYYSKGFDYALTNATATSFYTTYVRSDGAKMPRYGTDCSGFLSAAFKINRHTTRSFQDNIDDGVKVKEFARVGSYNVSSPTKAQLLAAYPLLQRGDAVVDKGYGHCFLISVNNVSGKYCICYNQTTYYTKLTVNEYADMADGTHMYRPFSKK